MVQHEALILTHTLAQEQTEAFKNVVIEKLSNLVFPHKIPDALKIAASHLDGMTDLIKKLTKTAKKLETLAYVEALNEPSIGTIANLLIDSMGVDVGLCYKLKDDNLVNISIRSKRGLPYHLGEITRNIADDHNGFGGGHKRASGASIPIKHLEKFIFDFDSALIRHKLNKM